MEVRDVGKVGRGRGEVIWKSSSKECKRIGGWVSDLRRRGV